LATRGDELTYRPIHADEIETCARIWHIATNDYIVQTGQEELPAELNPLLRLYRHLRSTDPERFVAAVQPLPAGGERLVGFAAAVQRERLWFLSMLFVLPEAQGARVGRSLLKRVLPGDDGTVLATATDSAQPISNALYSTFGIVPRMPLINLSGLPVRPDAFEALPSGVNPVSFARIREGGDERAARLAAAVDALDRDLLGAAHPVDHQFLAAEERRGWLYEGPDGAPLGYGYAGEAGRVGPVAARDSALLGPILGHLMSAVVPRGAFLTWIGGASDRAIVACLAAGLRLDRFPLLVCWDRPFADFSRYLPLSPGLL
jgi:hypothetical protein